jgi:hypothetical protein
MRPCPSCRRHVHARDVECPFCGAAVAEAPVATIAARATRAALFASATLAGSACWTSAPPAEESPRYAVPPGDRQRVDQQQQQRERDPAFTSRIRGTVTDARTGTPMANVQVTIRALSNPGGRIAGDTRTDASGVYVFDELPAGTYVVAFPASHPRQGPQQRQVELQVGESRQVDMALHVYVPPNNPNHQPMPYGAPPARRRVV